MLQSKVPAKVLISEMVALSCIKSSISFEVTLTSGDLPLELHIPTDKYEINDDKLMVIISLFLCRLKQKCEALQKEYEVKLAVERTKTKKLGLLMTNLQEDLLTAVRY